MKKNFLFVFAITLLAFLSMKCDAQVSLAFKRLSVNNINRMTNHITDMKMLEYGDYVTGVSIGVMAEVVNTGDSVLYFDEGIDNVRLALYFYEMGTGWRKMYLRKPQKQGPVISEMDSLAPQESLTIRRAVLLPASLFQEEEPLYYISSIASTMCLALEIPGYGSVLSGSFERLYLNGAELKTERIACYSCTHMYMLTHHNEMMEEYMSEEPADFGSYFSNYVLGKAFLCNMDFTRRLYPGPLSPTIFGK